MIPYLDAGFLLTLLFNTSRTATVNDILRDLNPPFVLNLFHQLQAENFLLQLVKSDQPSHKRAGESGLRLWTRYFSEEVLDFADADWPASIQLAITWNAASSTAPPPPLLLLHPALAVVSEASHFLSFDPRSRAAAKHAGLGLLPETL